MTTFVEKIKAAIGCFMDPPKVEINIHNAASTPRIGSARIAGSNTIRVDVTFDETPYNLGVVRSDRCRDVIKAQFGIVKPQR